MGERRKSLARDVATALPAVLLWLLCLELGLRLAGAKYTASLYTSERERGFALRPNSEGWQTEEQTQYIRINSDGMRDRERSAALAPGVLRIAVIGSSEVEARQVDIAHTFESVMERQLSKAAGGGGVEVLNFGVPGYALSQEYLTLQSRVWKYRPRVVVLAMSPYTILRNTRALAPGNQNGIPFYELKNGTLVPDAQRRAAPKPDPQRQRLKDLSSDAMNRSRLVSLANAARVEWPGMTHLVGWPEPEKASKSMELEGVPGDYIQTGTFFPDAPGLKHAFDISRAFLNLMKRECDEHGAEFWFVVIESNIQVTPNGAERAAFASRFGLQSLDAADERLKEFGKSLSIPVVALAPAIGAYAREHGIALHGFAGAPANSGHWNEVGHRIAGETISRALIAGSPAVQRFALAGRGERIP